ncbi:hypothetical protein AVEN_230398-1 [Araneus ventricosus]|uniref:Uncharacterized protein n=1 Tax=Araneus ventricosus TaxID=182803 RepID=A0A4Y2TSI9_ARAVE|nr:hypothetical protein AVEN_230398-1 [Araneus ventricosus]
MVAKLNASAVRPEILPCPLLETVWKRRCSSNCSNQTDEAESEALKVEPGQNSADATSEIPLPEIVSDSPAFGDKIIATCTKVVEKYCS